MLLYHYQVHVAEFILSSKESLKQPRCVESKYSLPSQHEAVSSLYPGPEESIQRLRPAV